MAEQIDADVQVVASRTVDTTWQTYTPTTAVAGTPVTLGNGILKGRYMRRGKTCLVEIFYQRGSTTTTAASGLLTHALPFAADLSWTGVTMPVGVMRAVNPNGINGHAILYPGDTANVYSIAMTGPGATVANNDGVSAAGTVAATGHHITLHFEYPVA